MFNPLRVTALVFLYPRPYLDVDAAGQIDIESWSTAYEWRRDAWKGFRDIAQPVTETIETEAGDCEDYALTAASWARANDRDGIGLAVCFDGVIPAHVIAFDTERTYSSGDITEESVSAYIERSEYGRALRRRIR